MFAFLTQVTRYLNTQKKIEIENILYVLEDLRGNVIRLEKVLLISFAYVNSQIFIIRRVVSPFHRAKHLVAVDDASSVLPLSNPRTTDSSYGLLLTAL